jgi:hypothetical protein
LHPHLHAGGQLRHRLGEAGDHVEAARLEQGRMLEFRIEHDRACAPGRFLARPLEHGAPARRRPFAVEARRPAAEGLDRPERVDLARLQAIAGPVALLRACGVVRAARDIVLRFRPASWRANSRPSALGTRSGSTTSAPCTNASW